MTYPRKNDAGDTIWACCVSSIGPVCQHRREPVDTWQKRLQAQDAEAQALQALRDAQDVVNARKREYFAAIAAHTAAVAADISDARGYPCDEFGYPIDPTKNGEPLS
jgi:hypothetical protein